MSLYSITLEDSNNMLWVEMLVIHIQIKRMTTSSWRIEKCEHISIWIMSSNIHRNNNDKDGVASSFFFLN